MAKNEPYQGVYAKIDFPPYVYREYPKMVRMKDGSNKIVNNHAEELRAIDEIVPAASLDKVIVEKAAMEKTIAELQAKIASMETDKSVMGPEIDTGEKKEIPSATIDKSSPTLKVPVSQPATVK